MALVLYKSMAMPRRGRPGTSSRAVRVIELACLGSTYVQLVSLVALWHYGVEVYWRPGPGRGHFGLAEKYS